MGAGFNFESLYNVHCIISMFYHPKAVDQNASLEKNCKIKIRQTCLLPVDFDLKLIVLIERSSNFKKTSGFSSLKCWVRIYQSFLGLPNRCLFLCNTQNNWKLFI